MILIYDGNDLRTLSMVVIKILTTHYRLPSLKPQLVGDIQSDIWTQDNRIFDQLPTVPVL